jgi:hypothetical protein
VTLSYVIADTRAHTATLADASVDLVFTSPPFLALRSYLPPDHPDKALEIGSEPNPAAFLDVLLELAAGWRRVLAPHGTLAVELGDTYSGSGGAGGDYAEGGLRDGQPKFRQGTPRWDGRPDGQVRTTTSDPVDYPTRSREGWPLPKSLACIPDLFKVALVYGVNPLTGCPSPAGRWRVRNDITWLRRNPPPGALGDKWRPASSRIITACTGGSRWFDLDAVRVPYSEGSHPRTAQGVDRKANTTKQAPDGNRSNLDTIADIGEGAPPNDWHDDADLASGVIILSSQPYSGSHYATFPSVLPRKIIECMCPRRVCRVCGVPSERVTEASEEYAEHLGKSWADKTDGRPKASGTDRNSHAAQPAGAHITSAERVTVGWTDCGHDDWRPGLVFDPFAGTGTTLAAAVDVGRDALGVDLDERNAELALERCGMFLEVTR